MTSARTRPAAPGVSAACAAAPAVEATSLRAQDAIFFRDPKGEDLLTAGRIAVFGAPNGAARLRSMPVRGRSRITVADGALTSPGS